MCDESLEEEMVEILGSTLRSATPLLFGATGGLVSERSGVVNIALEGMMLAGAFSSASFAYVGGNLALAISGGVLGGVLIAVLFAVGTVWLGGDHIVIGLAINIFVEGLTIMLCDSFFGSSAYSKEHSVGFRFIGGLPWIVYLAVVAPLVVGGIMWWTRFGLRLRACGENPASTDRAGVSVKRVRTVALCLTGVLCGLGGSFLSVGMSKSFVMNMTAGRGYIALAGLIFGKWKPAGVLGACVFFGFCEAIEIYFAEGVGIPEQFRKMVPYIIAIVVLCVFVRRAEPPGALGRYYSREG